MSRWLNADVRVTPHNDGANCGSHSSRDGDPGFLHRKGAPVPVFLDRGAAVMARSARELLAGLPEEPPQPIWPPMPKMTVENAHGKRRQQAHKRLVLQGLLS